MNTSIRLLLWLGCALGICCTLASSSYGQLGQSSHGGGGGGGRIVISGNSTIDSVSLTGTASLPLGEMGASVPANVTLTTTRANHNSTRSNHTQSAADLDTDFPDDLDGVELSLESSWDFDFDLVFTPLSTPFASALGDNLLLTVNDPPTLSAPDTTRFTFDADAPDFGLLRAGNHNWLGQASRAFATANGGLGPSSLENLTLSDVLGTDTYVDLGGGLIQHTFDVTLSLGGTLNGQPFAIDGLSGTVTEEATLAVQVVPEPTAGAVALAAFGLLVSRRRGRRQP